jgi:RNA polymerase sigma-70 factor (ECF subfamily)
MIPPEARGAWREIEERLRPYVARRVRSVAEVDDIMQEILVRIHLGLGSLHDGERFGGWVYRIARRAIADAVRARARAFLTPFALVAEPSTGEGADLDDDRAAVEATELQSDLGTCVALFVARLPSPYREAVTLTELRGLTQKDAAEMLGVSLSGMKSRVQRGREKIRDMFEECCEISLDCRGRVMACEVRTLDDIAEDCAKPTA